MKKNKMIIIVGLVLLVLGSALYMLARRNDTEKGNNDANRVLSSEEAESLIEETIRKIINVYEDPGTVFQVKEEEDKPDYIKILTYDVDMKSMFTEKGIKELENTKFNNKNFFLREENNVYFINDIPDDNKFSKSTITIGK